MADTGMYSMTDAMVYCMQQPGAVAVAFVELRTGRAIAGDGIDNLDIDALTPYFTEFLLSMHEQIGRNFMQDSKLQGSDYEDVPEIAITMKNRVHLLHPLLHEGTGLYLYLALDRVRGNVPLSRRCLIDIDANLHL